MNHTHEYPEDVARMLEICKERGVLTATDEHVIAAWEAYSEDYAAGWLSLGSDDEVFDALYPGLKGATAALNNTNRE